MLGYCINVAHPSNCEMQSNTKAAMVRSLVKPLKRAGWNRKRARDIYDAADEAELNLLQQGPKKLRSIYNSSIDKGEINQKQSDFLSKVPDEIVNHILTFCGETKDRFPLQTTCKTFRRISNNSEEILAKVKLGGDTEGKGGIISDDDTPTSASKKLSPFAKAGNLEAIYMLGMIKSYCHHDVDKGVDLLKLASKLGHVRATYTLGLILRDLKPLEARRYMNKAADMEYFPALQELLSAREMKNKFGEPSAGDLCQYLDPICLSRLLGRHYIICPHLRDLNTSHCWNPLCGRWAFRALNYQSQDPPHRHRPIFATIGKNQDDTAGADSKTRVSRMKMCSRCCRAKYCSKLCQVYDWRSGRHKVECQFL
mmetsp:Transcript_7151/g.10441  ORF Transcript_7151/g.10441 Transcript_7151/m.10441 type:complete len:368 (+) Transcript_7151:111-1214(+)